MAPERISYDSLKKFCVSLFLKLGLESEPADIISQALLEADLRGVHSHGLLRLPIYVKRMELGLVNKKAVPRVIKETAATAVLDGEHGMGHYTSYRAMWLAVSKARKTGIGAVGVRNSTHFGVSAYYGLLAVENGQIGIVLSNTTPLMAATGGAQRLIGNNPLCIAIPARGYAPIVLDMACSNAAIGKIQLAAREGREIPPGWGADKNGVETTDPKAVLDMGMLMPVGGHKGYGLALVIDIIAGVLTGSGFGKEVTPLYHDFINKQRTGHFMVAIDINHFINREFFFDRLDLLLNSIKNSPKAPGVKEIFLPGEIEDAYKRKSLEQGVALPKSIIDELITLAERFNLKDLLNSFLQAEGE